MTIPQQKIPDVWDKLSPTIREAILSDETTKQIALVCRNNGVPENQIDAVDEIIGDVLWGFIKPMDLQNELEARLKINGQTALAISEQINNTLFKELGIESANLTGVRTDKASGSFPLKPSFAPGQPFILHEEEARTAVGASSIKASLSRPSFYKPGFSQYSESYPEKPQAVKLELGGGAQQVSGGPAMVKVGQEEARVVHYSEMRTPLDPFAKPVPEPSPIEAPKKREVHPDNVINLKDLPL